MQLSGRKVSIFRLTLPLTPLFTPPLCLCFHTSTLHTRFHPLNHRFTLFINEHTLHRLFMALLSRSFLTLWLLNSTFLPEERPPASISPPGSELWAPHLIPETASAACRSRLRHPYFPALPCPLTCCSCSHDGPQTFYSGSCPPSPVVHPL